MPLKKSAGNMYSWVTHTHSHLGGECPHECSYCYVRAMASKFNSMRQRYGGPARLIKEEFCVKYGKGKTIFIEHMNDLFAEEVPKVMIDRVLDHCWQWLNNTYVFQTKNPARCMDFVLQLPLDSWIGTTIETNRSEILEKISKAPSPHQRATGLSWLPFKRFVTIEPVLKFDVGQLVFLIHMAHPDFVNIGADSKGRGLPEPDKESIMGLIEALKASGIDIRQKRNLARLMK